MMPSKKSSDGGMLERLHSLETTVAVEARENDLFRAEMRNALGEILAQTRCTNGRVTRLELWKNRIAGAIVILSLLISTFAGFAASKLDALNTSVIQLEQSHKDK